jgi:hypothetical protein
MDVAAILQSLVEPWPNTDIGWPDFISTTGRSPILDIIFQAVILALVFVLMVVGWTAWSNVYHTPSPPKILKETTRQPFSNSTSDLMINYQVATASFGGIYTEQGRAWSGYNGTVSSDAVHDQINAGARAIIFDVWPDPANKTQPIVATMEQNSGWWISSGGLTNGVTNSGYSNWKKLTRNSQDLKSLLSEASAAAFSQGNPQYTDPFFIILNLHGAMTIPYLNTVGTILDTAFTGRHMPTEYSKNGGASILCSAPVSAFQGRIFVTANIVIDPAFQSLPGLTTQEDVNTAALTQSNKFAEQINLLSGSPSSQNVYSIPGSAAITTTKAPACPGNTTATTVPLPKTTFCIIQPSIGITDTVNDTQYTGSTTYAACRKTGAQFVGVNMFDQDTGSKTLGDFLDTNLFGTYSFQRVGI